MKVLCKIPTKQTVKDVEYEVVSLKNKKEPTDKFFAPRVTIRINSDTISSLNTKNFVQMDGTPLPEINWVSPDYTPKSYHDGWISDTNLPKKGDYITCRNPTSKYLSDGKTYKVEDIRIVRGKWSSAISIKVTGYERWLSSHMFRYSLQLSRELTLTEIFEDKRPSVQVDLMSRVFDTFSPDKKKKILLTALVNSMIDNSRNNMTIIEWAVNKTGKKWNLKEEDFSSISKKSLNSLIKDFEK
jgi:hypothetical protein